MVAVLHRAMDKKSDVQEMRFVEVDSKQEIVYSIFIAHDTTTKQGVGPTNPKMKFLISGPLLYHRKPQPKLTVNHVQNGRVVRGRHFTVVLQCRNR